MSSNKKIRISTLQLNNDDARIVDFGSLIPRIIVNLLVSYCFLYAGVRMFLDTFKNFEEKTQSTVNFKTLFLLFIPFVVLGTWGQCVNKKRIWINLGISLSYVVVFAVYLIQRKQDFVEGNQRVKKYLFDYINHYYKTNLQTRPGDQNMCIFALSVWIFAIFLILFVISMFAKKRMVLFTFPLLVFWIDLSVGYAPSYKGLLPCVLGVLLAKGMPVSQDASRQKRQYNKHRYIYLFAAVSFALISTLVGKLLFDNAAEWIVDNKAQDFRKLQKQIEKKLEDYLGAELNEITDMMSGSQREAVTNRKPIYDGSPRFDIEFSNAPKQNVYYRCFYGMEYVSGGWEQKQYISESFETNNGLNSGGFAEWVERTPYRRIEEINNLSNRYQKTSYFVEYDIKSTVLGAFNMAILKDSKGVVKEGEYIYSKGRSDNSFEYTGYDILLANYLEDDTLSNYDYRNKTLDSYNAYVEKHYCKGSDKVPSAYKAAEILLPELEDCYGLYNSDGAYAVNCKRIYAAELVRNYLKSGTYSLDLPKNSSELDVVEYFLAESHTGYCVHFASAGTLILRAMNIPARYASGYVVDKDSVDAGDGVYTANVIDSDAHAWTEIYLENIGWVPVDMTPGYKDGLDYLFGAYAPGMTDSDKPVDFIVNNTEEQTSEDEQQGTDDNTEEITTQNITTEDVGTAGDNTETEGAATTTQTEITTEYTLNNNKEYHNPQAEAVYTALRRILYALLIMPFVMLALWISYKLITHTVSEKEIRRIAQASPRTAVRVMSRVMYKKLNIKNKRFRKRSDTDESLRQLLRRSNRKLSWKEIDKYMEITQKACYSNNEISMNEVEFCISMCYSSTNDGK